MHSFLTFKASIFKWVIAGIIFVAFYPTWISAQEVKAYKPTVSRILFLLDGSGSMKEKWEERSRFEIAKELLVKLVDSVEQKNPNVEFAVRVFGAQFPHEQKNCKDSKLLLPFAKNNAARLDVLLKALTPKGMTPIAYSISESVKDFPADEKSVNSIILITDGDENCDGNPCIASKELVNKRIALKPFIIGLNVSEKEIEKFNCVGTFVNTTSEASLKNTVGVIINQTLNTTTVQINLLDYQGNPTVTNVPFTLYDHYSGKVLYNFIHTIDPKGTADTLYLDPVGIYDIEVHTYPSVRKDNIELTPGMHNIIALDVFAGELNTNCSGASIANNDAQVLVRDKENNSKILNAQDLNEQEKFISNKYKLEILTTPEILIDTLILPSVTNLISIPNYGTVSISANESFLASIYKDAESALEMVERFQITNKGETRKLQPGKYLLVYKAIKSYDSETTQTLRFTVEEGRTLTLALVFDKP